MATEFRKRLELATYGYVRINFAEHVPDDIIEICIEYQPKIEIKFDIFCDELSEFVDEDGLKITMNERHNRVYATFASSIGWSKAWSKGVHYFSLKQIGGTRGRGLGSIGIVSSELIGECRSHNSFYILFNDNKQSMVYCLDGCGTIYKAKNGNYHQLSNAETWKDDDIVTVMVNCDVWTLEFYLNDKQIGNTVKIDDSKIYHAAFTAWDGYDANFELVESNYNPLQIH